MPDSLAPFRYLPPPGRTSESDSPAVSRSIASRKPNTHQFVDSGVIAVQNYAPYFSGEALPRRRVSLAWRYNSADYRLACSLSLSEIGNRRLFDRFSDESAGGLATKSATRYSVRVLRKLNVHLRVTE